MNKEMNQKISRFLDGELSLQELDQVLLEIKQQPELKNTLQRYQVMSHILKNDDITIADNSFLAKVQQNVEQEPHYFLPKQATKAKYPRIWKQVPLAIAASVAIVAVVFSQISNFQSPVSPEVIAQATVTESQARIRNELQHERLKAYLKAHSDDLYADGAVNFRSYAHVVSYGRDSLK